MITATVVYYSGMTMYLLSPLV